MRQFMQMAAFVLVFAAFGAVWPAAANTVFSNYNGVDCRCGFAGASLLAEGFTPSADSDFSGAAAFVANTSPFGGAESLSVALYSSAGGAPSSLLWASGTLSGPNTAFGSALVQADYAGASPILLQAGKEYFLTVDLPDDGISWLNQGTSAAPNFYSDDRGASWNSGTPQALQFEISGSPVSVGAVPEPSAWAMMLIGFAGLGFVGYRRAAKV
jgi:PEP-CTERM motif